MNILAVGDIVGKPGRLAFSYALREIKQKYDVDAVIVNGENAAHGNGITLKIARDLYEIGADVLTMGNHTWAKREIIDFIQKDNRIVRPANYPDGTPGFGSTVVNIKGLNIGVINLLGRVFMEPLESPFKVADKEIEKLKGKADIILVDFHAETTSEKIALGWHLDGRVSAIWGTHTHVQTADERVLPKGTGYITDLGMTGCIDAVIGVKKEIILEKFLKQMPVKFEIEERGRLKFNGAVFSIDENTFKCTKATRISVDVYQ